MFKLNSYVLSATTGLAIIGGLAFAAGESETVGDDFIEAQRAKLAANTENAGFGPQAPRDIESVDGANLRQFQPAPAYTEMNLCNIHFHEGAEHKGGDFTKYAGNGDGKGYNSGFEYSGELSEAELASSDADAAGLQPGDTVEVHYVHTTAQINPGPTLGACLSESIMNPQLRVEAQVYVLVNDSAAMDFTKLMEVGEVDGYHQALNIPSDTGTPVAYAGSTTGPSYNEAGSPLQVSWSVRPQVVKVNIDTVAAWFGDNIFDEKKAHAVRNLVTNPDLLAPIN